MGKYDATYRRCESCGFIFVPEPFWLPEAYQSAINRNDIGPVNRMVGTSRVTKCVIDLFLRGTTRYLDYGSGYGLYVRRMRDLGYDFTAYDKYCENVFAADFAIPDLNGHRFDLITSFEVMEHTESPMEVFDLIFAHADSTLFTTDLVPDPAPALGQWWYYGLDHGQHIAFFTRKALEHAARRFGKHLSTDGHGFHLITSRKVNARLFRMATRERWSKLWEIARPRRTLLLDDWNALRNRDNAALGIESV
jgi:hypothetical protein